MTPLVQLKKSSASTMDLDKMLQSFHMLAVFITVAKEIFDFSNIFLLLIFVFSFPFSSLKKHQESCRDAVPFSKRIWSYRPYKSNESCKTKRKAHGKKSPGITLTNQGHAHVFICIILWNTSLAIVLIFYLNLNSVTTKPSKFWNSKFNNNCVTHRKHVPSPDLHIPLCSSCHCYLARVAKEDLWVPSLGFPVQHISLWSSSAVHYSHNSHYLFFLLVFKALFASHFLPWVHYTWCRSSLRAWKWEGPSLLLRPGLVFVEN